VTRLLLAIDPGREKCGLAVVADDESLVERAIVPTAELPERVGAMLVRYAPACIVLGNGTSSRSVRGALDAVVGGEEKAACSIQLVDERRTTERAREEYWVHNPPRGLQRLLPAGLRVPPEPYDDLAALVMARDFLRAGGLKQDDGISRP
jgi:RNase H-fold protein (predicted Holliday junction resolvase)